MISYQARNPMIDRRGAGPPAPVPALFNLRCFQHGFSLSSPAIKPRAGPGVGNRTHDAGLQGDCPSTDRVDARLPSAAVLRTAVPTHGRGVNIYQAPWASGSGRARRGQRVARPTSPPWASSPPLPLLSTELPVWDNLGFFFWGIVLLHDPSWASHTRSSS